MTPDDSKRENRMSSLRMKCEIFLLTQTIIENKCQSRWMQCDCSLLISETSRYLTTFLLLSIHHKGFFLHRVLADVFREQEIISSCKLESGQKTTLDSWHFSKVFCLNFKFFSCRGQRWGKSDYFNRINPLLFSWDSNLPNFGWIHTQTISGSWLEKVSLCQM